MPQNAERGSLVIEHQCSIGDIVELVELLCLAILSTPREGGRDGGKIQDTVGGTAWCNDSDAF